MTQQEKDKRYFAQSLGFYDWEELINNSEPLITTREAKLYVSKTRFGWCTWRDDKLLQSYVQWFQEKEFAINEFLIPIL